MGGGVRRTLLGWRCGRPDSTTLSTDSWLGTRQFKIDPAVISPRAIERSRSERRRRSWLSKGHFRPQTGKIRRRDKHAGVGVWVLAFSRYTTSHVADFETEQTDRTYYIVLQYCVAGILSDCVPCFICLVLIRVRTLVSRRD